MARIDNLKNFLTDIANAIKDKTGKPDNITPANFDTEIASIETGGGSSTITKGLVINEYDENGYATDVSIVGFTNIPDYYCYSLSYESSAYHNMFYRTNFHLPENCTTIGSYAFYGCSSMLLTSLPSGITYIGQYAFNTCTNLALTELPSGLGFISQDTFSGCRNLALTELPSGITTIGSYAFRYCEKLKITEIPSGITSLPDYAFSGCTSIEHITILGILRNMNRSVFTNCTSLSYVSLPNVTSVPTIASNDFDNTPIKNGTGYVYVPDDLIETYKTATNWSIYANQIKGISELPTEVA